MSPEDMGTDIPLSKRGCPHPASNGDRHRQGRLLVMTPEQLEHGRVLLRRLGGDIHNRRKALRLTVEQVAGKAGISPRALEYLESGSKNARWLHVVAVSSALGLSVRLAPRGMSGADPTKGLHGET